MAFTKANLLPFGSDAKTGVIPALWKFWNEAGDTVTSAGYITDAIDMTVGDQVLVIDNDYGNNAWYNVSAISATYGATLVLNV